VSDSSSRTRSLVLLGLIGGIVGLALVLQQLRQEPGEQPRELPYGRPVDRTATLEFEAVRAPQDLGDLAMHHCRILVGFGPRYFGQPGWSKQLDHIVQTLTNQGLDVDRDTWTDRIHRITFSNVVATIPGKRKERIVLACHHDTKCTTGHPIQQHNFDFVGANDGASGVSLLLALAPELQKRANEATIDLVFFDGEESLDFDWNDDKALFGSKRFVQRHLAARERGDEAPIAAMILVDMVGRIDLHIQEELWSTERLRRICWSAAKATGHEQQFYRVSEGAKDDHVPFLVAGIPAIDLIDLKGNPYWHTPHDTLEYMSAASIQKVADVVLTMLPAVERTYVTARD
jgi:hypothetical protein